MATIHTLFCEQVIATDLESAWDFIRRPENLDRITPPEMEFRILSDSAPVMYDGLMIEYRIRIPLFGNHTWLTEIKHIRDHYSFVDEQRIGPYKLWYHYHEITRGPDGVRFLDRVHYAMPFGPLGKLAHALFVRRQLRRIFDFRKAALAEQLQRKA